MSLFFGTLFTLNKLTNDRELDGPALDRDEPLAGGQAGHLSLPARRRRLLRDQPLSAPGLGRRNSAASRPWRARISRRRCCSKARSTRSSNNLTIYVRSREGNELYGILVQDNRKPEAPTTIMAKRGAVEAGPEGPRVVLFEGNRQELDRKSGRLSVLYFKEYSFEVNLLGEERTRLARAGRALRARAAQPGQFAERPPIHRTKLIAEGHNRIVMPILALTLPFIALFVLLPGQFNKRGQFPRLLLAVVVAAGGPGLGGGVAAVGVEAASSSCR